MPNGKAMPMKRKFFIAHAGNSLEQVKASENIRDLQVQGMVYEWRVSGVN